MSDFFFDSASNIIVYPGGGRETCKRKSELHQLTWKDRTGFAAAIILLALGVPRDIVMRDYLLTARYFHPERELDRLRQKYQLEHMVAEAILPMLQVHEDYLGIALQHIDDNYVSVEDYLEQALGVGPVELAELRGRYLE